MPLYIVATPIGNLSEISERALDTLRAADYIACEDTRRSGLLLSRFGISKPLIKYEAHNEAGGTARLIELLIGGAAVALISDAGMPLISDPGSRLISACIEQNIPYTVISGPCACINALVLSGLDARSFCMLGFLPERKKDRDAYMDMFKDLQATLILYCPPHDLDDYLEYLHTVLGPRKFSLIREITKLHEQVAFGVLGQPLDVTRKGEMVLVVEGAPEPPNDLLSLTIPQHVGQLIAQGLTKNDAIKRAAKERGIHKNEVYKEVINDKL